MPKAPLGYVLEGDVLVVGKKYAQAAVLYEKAYIDAQERACRHQAVRRPGGSRQGRSRAKRGSRGGWPSNPATLRHGAISRTAECSAEVRARYRRIPPVLERQPKDAVALNNVAWALNKLKDFTALRYAQQAHELSPADGESPIRWPRSWWKKAM